ncbi:RNA methyltransferase, RsmE family [gut metagenome]|uniref:16S rRNA (uracil(1498)-N(3))-methyltransferase n=1 Tax=gut metagenome TaxID=749906 RepID=J9H4D9_9ZZZZ
MKEVHLFLAPDIETTHELPAEEAAHAVRVLRMKEGDEVLVTDGKGHFFDGEISTASPKHCGILLNACHEAEALWKGKIHLAVAPTKMMDRMEWFAEKATEIGFNQLTFLLCKNSERKVIKTERIQKIVAAATKQSHKAWLPEVAEMTAFEKFIRQPFEGQKFIAHCWSDPSEMPFLGDVVQSEGDALILIGPEGDFSQEEVKMAEAAGFQAISLGKSRLRTETAALVAVHLAHLAKRC